MDTNGDSRAGTITATRSPETDPPHAPTEAPRPARAVGSLTRGLFLVLLVMASPAALIVWTATPRITSPTELAEPAIAIGLTEAVRGEIVDELSSELAERRNSPTESDQMRLVFERSLSQAWFDEQVLVVATELDRWLDGTNPEPPELIVDLRPVKASLAADPEALFLVADLIGTEQSTGSIAIALAGVPDEVSLLSEPLEPGSPEGLYTAREMLGDVRMVRLAIPVVLLVMFALTVLLARRDTRVRSAGRTLAIIGVPLLVASFVMPMVATRVALSSMPSEIPIDAGQVEGLLSWMLEPVRPVGFGLVVVGAVVVGASVAMDAVRRRNA
jgi:hypothetical protein